MSSLWFQRTQTEASISNDLVQKHPSNLTSIIAAAGSELPLLAPEHLSFDKFLGKGSSFVVNRELYSRFSDTEPYYVAVKHIIVADQAQRQLQQHYDKLVRELRVLTHPNLKENQYILKILAYGWTDSPKGRWPYLVVDCSTYGTLNEFLQRFETNWVDRREFGLDVALGLKALHDSNIIHGDVKPSNVLVFEAGNLLRHQMARISDFGGAIFDLDDDHAIRYGGTIIYNAPEQEQRGKYKSEPTLTREQLYQADIYSFGITLWEILKQGESFIDNKWLSQGETKIEFLNKIHENEEDPLLHRAEAFCKIIFSLTSIADAALDCFRMTLRDEASQRSSITQIVSRLTHNNLTPRPAIAGYPGRWAPPLHPSRSPAISQRVDVNEIPFTGYKLVPRTTNSAVRYVDDSSTKHHQTSLKAVDDVSKDTSKWIMTVVAKPNASQSSYVGLVDLDLFQASLMPSPPWSVQCEVVKSWQAEAASTNSLKRYQACLQLAICYHLGYGVQPDRNLMLRYLTISLEGNATTKVLYHRLISAMTLDVKQPNLDMMYMANLDRRLRHHPIQETYFAARVRLYQQLQMRELRSTSPIKKCKQHRSLKLTELINRQDFDLLSGTLRSDKYNNTEISCALLDASRCGNASMVQLICAFCDKFVHDESLPTPLHWLILFEESEAAIVAKALICGVSEDQDGPCKANLNSLPTTDSGTLFVAEHCLELFGTPLHWAVRTRNLKLVELLVGLGADINAYTEIPTAFITNIHRPLQVGLSPLDLAVLFHLPEIVDRLLGLGANWDGGGGMFITSHPAFLCIGLPCVPFSRYIIHGKHYKDALKETIRVLIKKGYSVNDTNAEGDNPIKVALCNTDCESYVIEELLIAGALPPQRSLKTSESAIDIAISHAPFRRYSVENLRLILPYVHGKEFNPQTFDAIHAAAIGGSEAMVQVLSTADGFDIDATTPTKQDGRHGGQTALHLAAMAESVDVISLLIRKGANMDIRDAFLYTPLQLAIFHRRIEAADALIELGADVFFVNRTVLHVAVAGVTSGYSLVKHLLTKHSRLHDPSILNAVDHVGWTALHNAAYFGDYEAVETLLAKGADRTLMDTSRGPMPGRTPLERVVHELWRLSINVWDRDLNRIIKGGLRAKDRHVANLREILQLLKEDEFS